MKLRELIKENDDGAAMPEDVVKFLDDYGISARQGDNLSHRSSLTYDGAEIVPAAPNINSLTITGGKQLMLPWKNPPCKFSGFKRVQYGHVLFNDMQHLIDAETIFIGHCDVKSLKGLEKLKDVNYFRLSFFDDRTTPIGLLPLMKLPADCVIDISYMFGDTPISHTAQKIVDKFHLNSDVLEFQNALIDAGLEDYATL